MHCPLMVRVASLAEIQPPPATEAVERRGTQISRALHRDRDHTVR